jgi:splicing suppressor protein 51
LDWAAQHKKQCKVLQQINEIDLEDYRESRTWEDYRQAQVRKSDVSL